MTRRGTSIQLAAALALLVAAAPRGASAEPVSAEAKAAAQALFDQGMKLAAEGRYQKACPKLAESQALDPAIGTRFYLADCFEHVGRVASAWTNFVQVADEARTLGQRDRERVARQRADALRARLPRLTIRLAPADRGLAGVEIRRDDVPVGEAQRDAPIPVDPGPHTVEVTAPGRKAWTTTVVLSGEGATAAVDVPPLESLPHRPALAPLAPLPPAPRALGARKTGGFVMGGVGVAGLGAGTAFGIRAALKQGSVSRLCDDTGGCTTLAAVNGLNQAGTSADVATGLLVGGSALLATGAVLVFTAPSASPPRAGRRGLELGVGPTGAFVGGRF
jgi:hypothetical protein